MSRSRRVLVYWSSATEDDVEIEFSVGPPERSGAYLDEREVELIAVRDASGPREDIIETPEFQKALDVLRDEAAVQAWENEADERADAQEREADWRREERLLGSDE